MKVLEEWNDQKEAQKPRGLSMMGKIIPKEAREAGSES